MEEKKRDELLKIWDDIQNAIKTEEDFYFFFGRLLEKKMFQVVERWHTLERAGAFDKIPESKEGH